MSKTALHTAPATVWEVTCRPVFGRFVSHQGYCFSVISERQEEAEIMALEAARSAVASEAALAKANGTEPDPAPTGWIIEPPLAEEAKLAIGLEEGNVVRLL